MKLLAIALGGAAGSLARFGLGGLVQRLAPDHLPLGTLAVNVLGCLVMGAVGALFLGPYPIRDTLRIGVVVGLLGGFTTYSSFAWQTYELAAAGRWTLAAANILLTNLSCLAGVWLGVRVCHALLPVR
ncbi:MAG: fluoride efflux transporter CrcB [Phycisphaerae bacterium]